MKSSKHVLNVSLRRLPARTAEKVLLVSVLGLLSFSLACGSSGSRSNPPVKGNFSNASLIGQYTYSLSGISEISNTTSFASYTEAGVFTADGKGNISGGTDDFAQNGSFGSGSFTGTYSINNDGTGRLNFNFTNGSGNISLGLTLVDSSRFYLIERDVFASGGGSGEMQESSAFTSVPSGIFALRVHANSNAQGSAATVGKLASTGGTISGNADVLRGGVLSSVTLTGSMSAPGMDGRGTLTVTDSGGTTSNFAYYGTATQISGTISKQP